MITCSTCKTSKDTSRLPSGWKNFRDQIQCQKCWRERYVLRAITMPVASPINGNWPELQADLRAMWIATTQASNWVMTELYARDCRRNGQEKMPPMERVYLYPEIRHRFPELPSRSATAIEQAVQKRYRKERYELIWTCARSLSNFRYPVPFPSHNQGWAPTFEDDRPTVSVRIGEKRWQMRLKGGARYRRQLGGFRQIVAGEAARGQIALLRRKDHETGRSDILCKMVAWFPRQAADDGAEGVMRFLSGVDFLLCAEDWKENRIRIWNADHVRRWAAEHSRRLQRWSEDTKAEARPHPRLSGRRRLSAVKYKNRMDSACHEISAQAVQFAARRRMAKIEYDDRIQSYCEKFPWARLREMMAQKAYQHGIQFEAVKEKK